MRTWLGLRRRERSTGPGPAQTTPRQLDKLLLLTGIACLLAAITAGGLKAWEIEFPTLNSISRIALALFGTGALVASAVFRTRPEDEASPTSANVTNGIPRRMYGVGNDDNQNRALMIDRVRKIWIANHLNQSLYAVARIELGLEEHPELVRRPSGLLLSRLFDKAETNVPLGTSIASVFDDAGRALLIVGDPGSGKTTLLLELAEELLTKADAASEHPIPVVFNLASWPLRRATYVGDIAH